jgi:hypothetical protein
MRARRRAPKADEPVPPPHLAVLDGTRAGGFDANAAAANAALRLGTNVQAATAEEERLSI